MFYYLNGKIAMLDHNLAVVDCGGVGYTCYTTSYTISQLKIGQAAKLYTHCNIREDAFDLYGFSTREERRCFDCCCLLAALGPRRRWRCCLSHRRRASPWPS
ncbi:MAG: OB-fold domain-containing protein [Oscillospiraceae bacterium]